jgi:hypothetical protein
LGELNICIKVLLVEVNHKPLKQLKGSRQTWFDSIDKAVLRPIPRTPYRYTDIKRVKVIELLFHNTLIASHAR